MKLDLYNSVVERNKGNLLQINLCVCHRVIDRKVCGTIIL